jgi:hypothetical protein
MCIAHLDDDGVSRDILDKNAALLTVSEDVDPEFSPHLALVATTSHRNGANQQHQAFRPN